MSHLTSKIALELWNTELTLGLLHMMGGLSHPAHLNKDFSLTHMKATGRARTGRAFKSLLAVLLFHSFLYEHDFHMIH